jgi:hypothetical protein
MFRVRLEEERKDQIDTGGSRCRKSFDFAGIVLKSKFFAGHRYLQSSLCPRTSGTSVGDVGKNISS